MSPDRERERDDPGRPSPDFSPETRPEQEANLPVDLPLPRQSKSGAGSHETLPAGRILGSFRILQYIGGGGMGQVYRAIDKRLNREVAIKILPLVQARELDLMSRFQAEARAASSLNHPNVVAVHDIGREGDLCWIVSELVDGQSLRALIESGPLKSRRIIEIGAQIAEGLAAAHAAGLIHRDLKPENIMLTRENRVKILDFGLAKSSIEQAVGPTDATITRIDEVLGTPGYMSPEQVGGGPVDQRSDIFSLGVILYEMLTQKRPFSGTNRVSVMHATLMDDPPPIPPLLAPELARITERCLEKQPQRRFQSAADAAFALHMVSGSSSQNPISPRPRRRWWRGAMLAGACALGAIGFFWAGLKARSAAAPLQGTMRQLTWDDALTTDAAISPDGRLVAYASDRANARDLNIYVQQVDGGATLQLTNDAEVNDEPTFSPDGSRIAFQSRRGNGGVYEVPAIGGEKYLIAAGGRHPRLSPDGQLILYAKVGSEASLFGGWGAELFVQPLADGPPVLLTRGCNHVVAEAVWSPDSQHVLATATCGGQLGLWLISRDGKSRQRTNGDKLWNDQGLNLPHGLTFQNLDQWLSNPSRVMLPLMQGDATYEAAIPISSEGLKFLGSPTRIDFGPGSTVHGSMSADGRVALTNLEQFSNLFELPIDSKGHATGAPVQITSSRAPLVQQALSPDGRTLAFVLSHAEGDELQVLSLANRKATPTTVQTGWLRHPAFSADGCKISYETAHAALEIDTNGGASSNVFPDEDGYVSDWSPDGREFLWIGRTPNQPSIAVVDRATLRRTFVLDAAGLNLYQAHFSPDQRYVTFNAVEDQHSRIYAAPLRGGSVPHGDWIPLTDGATWDDKPRLSRDGKLLFFVSQTDGFPCIWVERLSADMHPLSAPQAVFHSHSLRCSIAGIGLGSLELNVARGALIFGQGETAGNIWVLDPPETGKR